MVRRQSQTAPFRTNADVVTNFSAELKTSIEVFDGLSEISLLVRVRTETVKRARDCLTIVDRLGEAQRLLQESASG